MKDEITPITEVQKHQILFQIKQLLLKFFQMGGSWKDVFSYQPDKTETYDHPTQRQES